MARRALVENISYRIPTQRELQILTKLGNDRLSSIHVTFARDKQIQGSLHYHYAILESNNNDRDFIRTDIFYQLMLNGWIVPYIHGMVTKRFTISDTGRNLLLALSVLHRAKSGDRG